MKVLGHLALLFFFSCTSSKGNLEEQVQTLDLTYISFACDCANWADSSDLAKYKSDDLDDRCIYVEPASPSLILPDSIGHSSDKVRFTGQFYINKGFPEGYSSHEDPEPARVFRYIDYKILKSNHERGELEKLNIP